MWETEIVRKCLTPQILILLPSQLLIFFNLPSHLLIFYRVALSYELSAKEGRTINWVARHS